jgi:phage gp37-like protein
MHACIQTRARWAGVQGVHRVLNGKKKKDSEAAQAQAQLQTRLQTQATFAIHEESEEVHI